MLDLSAFNAWIAANPQWLALLLFCVALLECFAVIGVLFPGVLMLFALGVLAGSGHLGLGETLLLAFAGGLLGDLLSYAIGRYFHQDLRRLPILRHHPEWFAGAEGFFARNGFLSLLVGRFIGPLRPFLPMIAGMLDMPFGRFLLVSCLAAMGWSIAYLLPGWVTGAAIRLPLPEGFWPEAAVLGACLAIALILMVRSKLHEQPQAQLLVIVSCLALLLGMLIGWPHLAALDQGLIALVQEHRSVWLDSWMVALTRVGDFRTQLLLAGILLAVPTWLEFRRHAGFVVGSMLGTALLNTALKWSFARLRPDIIAKPLTDFSMPSGHSSASFAFFLAMGVLIGLGKPPRVRLAWMLLASLPAASIALSRVYLGAHWPSDVITGALLGSLVCALSLCLVERSQSLAPLPAHICWKILPAALLLLSVSVIWGLNDAIQHYQPR